jgi:hypothetical protein
LRRESKYALRPHEQFEAKERILKARGRWLAQVNNEEGKDDVWESLHTLANRGTSSEGGYMPFSSMKDDHLAERLTKEVGGMYWWPSLSGDEEVDPGEASGQPTASEDDDHQRRSGFKRPASRK